MKFLYGKVTVLTIEGEAESLQEFEKKLAEDAERTESKYGEKKSYKLYWTEEEGHSMRERDIILGAFLGLIQNEIPLTQGAIHLVTPLEVLQPPVKKILITDGDKT